MLLKKIAPGLLIGCFLAASLVLIPGCAGRGQYNPRIGVYDTNALANTIVVSAETLRATALEVFGALMDMERLQEADFRARDPAIHTFVNDIRRHGAQWLDALTAAKVAYQSDRTQDLLTVLNLQMANINALVIRANKILLTKK